MRAGQSLAAQPACSAPPCKVGSRCWERQAGPPARCSQHGQRGQQRQAVLPVACAGKSDSTSACPQHFLRPSLLATGVTEPQDVLQLCLALFRKADLAALQQYLPASYATANAELEAAAGGSSSGLPSLPVGPLQVVEQGPLASLAGILDVGARRVLPGHLLRRSQVLSTLRLSPDSFQQRVALTAKLGETSLFVWLLCWHAGGEEDGMASGLEAASRSSGSSSSSSSSGVAAAASGSGRWVLESVCRDVSTDLPLPTTPHPQAAPEAIVKAQLAALQRGDLFEASCYSMWHGRGMNSRKASLGSHHDALRAKLQQEPCGLLLGHAVAHLGTAALSTQRELVQEVSVLGAAGASARFVWRLNLATQGCWMVSGIFAADELAQQQQQQQ